MGRYKRKTAHGTWNAQQLQAAIDAVNDGKSIRASAAIYKIPESSLRRRMKAKKLSTPVLGMSTTFTAEQEKIFANYLMNLSNIFFGLTSIQCRKIAYEIAEKMKLNHKFNKIEKLAGKEWLQGFLKRNPQFNVRKSESVNTNRIKEFIKDEVITFFNNLEFLIAHYKFLPSRIYNVNETEIFTLQETKNICNSKGEKTIGIDTGWERENKTTVICAVNASGIFTPPMFICPLEQDMPLLRIGASENSIIECNSNGCTNEKMYLIWLKHFVQLVKPTKSDPILLILNSHNSHTSLNAYEFCKDNNIQILSLPPHVGYKMQPLNLTVFGPLKRAYYKECELYMKNNNSKQVTPYEVGVLFAKAFNKVAIPEKGIRGFCLTGIWPVDPFIFYNESCKVTNENNDLCKIETNVEDIIPIMNTVDVGIKTIQNTHNYINSRNKNSENSRNLIKKHLII